MHQACIILFLLKQKISPFSVDEVGRIISSHLLARATTYNYIKLVCMHDGVTYIYNIVASLNPTTLHISRRSSMWKALGL